MYGCKDLDVWNVRPCPSRLPVFILKIGEFEGFTPMVSIRNEFGDRMEIRHGFGDRMEIHQIHQIHRQTNFPPFEHTFKIW